MRRVAAGCAAERRAFGRAEQDRTPSPTLSDDGACTAASGSNCWASRRKGGKEALELANCGVERGDLDTSLGPSPALAMSLFLLHAQCVHHQRRSRRKPVRKGLRSPRRRPADGDAAVQKVGQPVQALTVFQALVKLGEVGRKWEAWRSARVLPEPATSPFTKEGSACSVRRTLWGDPPRWREWAGA